MASQKILVVDDEPHITYMLTRKLKQAGIDVLSANNGEVGFQTACEELPDLIVTDYQMPRLSGYDMAVQLRRHEATSEIPLVMLTARGHRLSPTELACTNIRQILSKPFSIKELIAAIDECSGPQPDQDESTPEPKRRAAS